MSMNDLLRGPDEAATASQRRIVTFNVGGGLFGIDVGVVREIKGWQEATPLPHAPSYVRGVINLRGLILAVYDLRARLGGGLTTPTPKHVNLVVDVADRTAGLLVDSVSDIVDIQVGDVRPAPAVATNGLELIEGVALIEQTVVALLRLDAILREDAFALPAAQAA